MKSLHCHRFLIKIAKKKSLLIQYGYRTIMMLGFTLTGGATPLQAASPIVCEEINFLYDGVNCRIPSVPPTSSYLFVSPTFGANIGTPTPIYISNPMPPGPISITPTASWVSSPTTYPNCRSTQSNCTTSFIYCLCAPPSSEPYCNNCFEAFTNISISTSPITPPPAWKLEYSAGNDLGVSTTQNQDQMLISTSGHDANADLTCNGNSGMFFALTEIIGTGKGFIPVNTQKIDKPCENGEIAFECKTTLKDNKTGKFVPITMPAKSECASPLPPTPSNCYISLITDLVSSITYFCPV